MHPENPLHLPTRKLTLGCPVLDRLLHGGVPCGSVTEIAGENGSGKTQLCLQLLLSALLPPSSAASLFIHSEFPFPLRRLRQLSLSLPSSIPNPLDHVFVRGAHSPDELLSLLSSADALLSRPPSAIPIRLIVVDSIASLFRSDFDNTPSDLKRRCALFFRIASKLKEQAKIFNLAVVVTNQVVDVVGSEEGSNGVRVGNFGEFWSSGRRVVPALGLSWANCVNTRLFLSRRYETRSREEGLEIGDFGGLEGGEVRTRRVMQVVFAPHLPESSSELVIVREGVFGISL